MSYNANDEKQVKKARKRAEISDAMMLDVVRTVMQTSAGRAWVYKKLEACHIYGNPFIPGQPDATAFCLGEANQGKILLAEVQTAAPELYLKMIKEAKSS